MKTQTNIAHDVVATLAGRVIDTRINEQRAENDLNKGLQAMYNQGVSLDDLSASSGLTVAQVRKALERPTFQLDSVESLFGLV